MCPHHLPPVDLSDKLASCRECDRNVATLETTHQKNLVDWPDLIQCASGQHMAEAESRGWLDTDQVCARPFRRSATWARYGILPKTCD